MARSRSPKEGGSSREAGPRGLNLYPFQRALKSLEIALALPKNDIVRDAAIQRFKYTYELARNMIRLHMTWAGLSDVDFLSRAQFFREAARMGVIADVEAWFAYNVARNKTPYTYDEKKAEEVYETAKNFAVEARTLLSGFAR